MAIVTFYNGDPKDAPKTTMPAHLGAGRRRLQKMGDRPADHRPGSL